MKTNPMLWVLRQLRRRIPMLLLLTAAEIGRALFGVAFALGSRGVIDSAVSRDPQAFASACVAQFSIIAGIILCLTLQRHLREKLYFLLDRDWKQQLLHILLGGSYADVSAYHSGELMNRLNQDVDKVCDGLVSILPNFISMCTQLIAAVAVLGTMDLRFTLVIGTAGAILVLVTAALRQRLKGLHKYVSEQDGIVSSYLQESMEKLLIVQAMDVSEEVERRADVLLDKRYAIQTKRKNVNLMTHTAISVASYGAGFLALVWGSYHMLMGRMSFGSLTALIQLVNQLQNPFLNMSGLLPRYSAMSASAERLMELTQVQAAPANALEDPAAVYESMTFIEAEDLSFSYDRDQVLCGSRFTLPKGAFAVITGPSGIGKSTILKLLLGIFEPDAGSLYLRCRDGRLPLDRGTRRLFAYVPQGNLLFSGTLRDNLTLASPEASEEAIRQAVYVSAMEDFLPQLPQGLDTLLGESGMGLSEGQAQRLAIARAVLGGAPILLLDECTSALDETTEQKILLRLHGLPGRTIIAVTHRPAAAALSDWRLEVSDGRIRTLRNPPH